MKFEDIRVGDLLYNKDDAYVQYILVVWKNRDNGSIGGRVGYKKGTLSEVYKIDLENGVEIDINSYHNLSLSEIVSLSDVDELECLHHKRDQLWAGNCEVIDHLTKEEMYLFWTISDYSDKDENINPGVDFTMSLRNVNSSMEMDRTKLALLEQAVKEATIHFNQYRDTFIGKYYPTLKECVDKSNSGSHVVIERYDVQ